MEVRIDRALIMANTGSYLQALQILMPRDLLPTKHEELDVVARLYVKTGEHEKARICLQEAIKKAPHIKTYQTALNALDLHTEKECKIRKALMRIGVIVGISCIVGFLSFLSIKYGMPYVRNLVGEESFGRKKSDLRRPAISIEIPKSTKLDQK